MLCFSIFTNLSYRESREQKITQLKDILPVSSKGIGRVNNSEDKMKELREFYNEIKPNSNGNRIVKTIINNSIKKD